MIQGSGNQYLVHKVTSHQGFQYHKTVDPPL